MEERYVQYLEKAKMVLRQMDPRNSNSISHQEIQSLRKQVEEKERKIKELEVNPSRGSFHDHPGDLFSRKNTRKAKLFEMIMRNY